MNMCKLNSLVFFFSLVLCIFYNPLVQNLSTGFMTDTWLCSKGH